MLDDLTTGQYVDVAPRLVNACVFLVLGPIFMDVARERKFKLTVWNLWYFLRVFRMKIRQSLAALPLSAF